MNLFTRIIAWVSFACTLLLLPQLITAQTTLVKGKITDATSGKGIENASIMRSKAGDGTTSDKSGEFSLQLQTGEALIISYIGYTSQVITPSTGFISVQLVAESQQLGDVVVTALGVKKDKKIIGYSTQEVRGKDLVKAREPNPINSLVGKVAGLTVGASAELLGTPQVLLRGGNITLYVVDGVPINSDTWNISPDDIESYTVLKGPVASALYGYRGQNGAIIINTKKGTKDKRGYSFEFNSSTMVNKGFIALPKTQDLYGPGDHGRYKFVDGKGAGVNDNDYDIWGPRFEGQLIEQYDSPVDPVTGIRTPTPWTARGKDNLKRFIQAGVLSTNNLAVSASGEKYDLRFSVGQTYQRGIVPNTDLNGTNFNLASTLRFSKRLSLDANINFNKQYTDNIPDVNYGPNSVIYNMTIWGGADWNIDDMRNYWQPGKVGEQSIYAEYQRYHNPYFMSYEWLRGHQKNDVYGYATLNYKLNNFVDLMVRSSITTYDLTRTEKMPFSAHPYGREEGRGDYREDKRSLFENNTEAMARLKAPRIAGFFDLSGFVGANLRTFKYNSSFVTTNYLNVPNVYTFSNSRNPVLAYNFGSDMRVQSAYYSFDFGLGKYANINTTGRVDKLSALSSKNNTFFYPSVNISTVLSDYIDMPSIVSFFKLRGSYAQVRGGGSFVSNTIGATPNNSYPLGYGAEYTSSYGGPSYAYNNVYSTSVGYNNTTEARFTDKLVDDNIKPDNRSNIELGLDVKFFNNRFGFDVAYFNYIDGPQIFNKQISAASGYSNYTINATKTQKKGLEISLAGTALKSASGLNWDVLLNWSTFKETFKELPPGINALNTFYKKGSRTDEVYIGKFARTEDGQIINDGGGRPIVLPVAQYAGNSNPDWVWGFNNKFSYKNIGLSFQFDGRVGGVMEDYVRKKTYQGGRHIETTEGALGEARYNDYKGIKSYVGEGVQVTNNTAITYDPLTGVITNYNTLQFGANTTKTYAQDYVSRVHGIAEPNMMSKSYLKLREIVLSYNLPVKKSLIQSANISFVARNILYVMKDNRFNDVDIDQYAGSQAGTNLQTPTTRSFGFNLNVVF
ncbi:MAG: SusC/RagA family TonB-linked outer membrane protein [Ferruginibacter sp.]|nr:SusC/RagA family TonB-linked outer membrane protein [Ferruginibacter sp.]